MEVRDKDVYIYHNPDGTGVGGYGLVYDVLENETDRQVLFGHKGWISELDTNWRFENNLVIERQ